jgi:YfiH family protein
LIQSRRGAASTVHDLGKAGDAGSTTLKVDGAEWAMASSLVRGAGFLHAFCVHGRPDDVRTCAAVAPGRRLQRAIQVHGDRVAVAATWSDGEAPEADAVISADPSVACAVRTADCAPVLVACARTRAVAAVHAGWRGVACGVIPAAISAMVREFGASPADMVAAVGPCARSGRYEIGEEVASAMAAAGCRGAVVRRSGAPRPFLDMARAAAIQLVAAGIAQDRIDADPPCSIGSPWCPSHRREPSDGSRMLSLVVPTL